MQMVKIQISDKSDSARAFVEMSRRGRIVCLPDNVYVVPQPALQFSTNQGVQFQELGRGGLDYAEQAMRAASPQ